jgi:meso-butanediol dehydrogenase/(S,S)-butanediol dehydrogenase/diacetyl reductase
MRMLDLSGHVAAVTGGAQGMGRAMVTALAVAGADIVLLDLDADGNEATAAALRGLGRRGIPISGHVADNSVGKINSIAFCR